MNFLKQLFSSSQQNQGYDFKTHPRLKFDRLPAAIYAIGDVHGELDKLLEIEQKIYRDMQQYSGEKWIMMIGDLVDRGPKSAQVIDHMLMRCPQNVRRFALLGNHELFMLQARSGELAHEKWLQFGGKETLLSYSGGMLPRKLEAGRMKPQEFREFMDAIIPQEHYDYLASMALSISVPDYFFAHAGVRQGIDLDEQNEMDLLMIRDGFIDTQIDCPSRIVHGHTIFDQVLVLKDKIGIDTGAYATQNLSAVRIQNNSEPFIFNTQ